MSNILTRRTFLERSAAMALAAASSSFLNVPLFLRRAFAAGSIPAANKKLLFIFLRGGNDALNTVIPWADSAYSKKTRPTLYLPPPDPHTSVTGRVPESADLKRVVDLGNDFAGMHPGLIDLAPVFNDGQVAFVHRVGYPKQSRSHFDSQRYWESGLPANNFAKSGILYRAITTLGLNRERRFPLISVQPDDPLLLRGPLPLTTNLSDPNRYGMLGVAKGGTDKDKLWQNISTGFNIPYPAKASRDLLFQMGTRLSDALDVLKTLGLDRNDYFDTDGKTHLFPIDLASDQKGFNLSSFGGAFSYFQNLKIAAQVLAHTDAIAAGITLDGFDTHGNQGALRGPHPDRMRWLGWTIYGLRKFFTEVDPLLWQNTLVVTLSEFGRTSQENGSGGTDHAEAGAMIVAGGKIKGGVYQCGNDTWTIGPKGAMFQVTGRYLRRTVDYRSVLGEIIRDHLGATPAQLESIIPGYADRRENLLAGGITLDGTRIAGELDLLEPV
ncbi:MAG: DUF1501 domain-containing protein [Verrucomicrobiales bacterium]|nr:DUF1501 domain-containing protein [Verrucomicrobiales bacterium]